MGALEVRAKSNLYGLPKKEANRILSKCEQANRIEEAPFSASLSTDRGGNLEFLKMPPNRNPVASGPGYAACCRHTVKKTAIAPRQLGYGQASLKSAKNGHGIGLVAAGARIALVEAGLSGGLYSATTQSHDALGIREFRLDLATERRPLLGQ